MDNGCSADLGFCRSKDLRYSVVPGVAQGFSPARKKPQVWRRTLVLPVKKLQVWRRTLVLPVKKLQAWRRTLVLPVKKLRV